MSDDDFDFEPIKGLPKEPPQGERILWSGSPEKWQLGHQVFRTGWIGVLFAVLAVSSIFSGLSHGIGPARIAVTFASLVLIGGAVIGFAMVFGWLVAINTVYTITNKRVVIRHGVTLPMAVNIPFTKVALAASKIRPDGSGDISISLLDGNRVSWFAVWPHKRPWSWQATTPALRSVADAASVAKILSDALAVHVAQEGDAYQASPPKIVRTKPRVSAISAAAARVEPDYRTADA